MITILIKTNFTPVSYCAPLSLAVKLDDLMLANALQVAAVAHGDISIVAAQHHLCAFGNDMAIAIDTGIDGSLRAAVAHRLDLLDHVRQFHQPVRSRE